MPTFFSADSNSPVGKVVQCKDIHTKGTMQFVRFDDPETISFSAHKAIITRVSVAHQCNFQFLHTIGNEIYVYVFGDRIGQLTISGLSFTSNNCESSGGHGFERVLQWYEDYRVASRKDPIRTMIGRTAISGFVVGLQGDVVDPSTRMMQWQLSLMVLPKRGS